MSDSTERMVFSDKFMEIYGTDEDVRSLVEQVEDKLQKLTEQYGVRTWEELPEEVLKNFEVAIKAEAGGSEI
jgi:hypothetical protein